MVNQSVTSWCESGPWCVGSRMTSPFSTLDWLVNFYCDIQRGHRQITAAQTAQIPSSNSGADAHDCDLGESSATTGVFIMCVCFSPASHSHELGSAAAEFGRISDVRSSLLQGSDNEEIMR